MEFLKIENLVSEASEAETPAQAIALLERVRTILEGMISKGHDHRSVKDCLAETDAAILHLKNGYWFSEGGIISTIVCEINRDRDGGKVL